MVAPRGLKQIEGLYGSPGPYIREDGHVSPLWEQRMVRVAFPAPLALGWRVNDEVVIASGCRVNQAIAPEVIALFLDWDRADVWHRFITFDGAYTWRPKRGSNNLSMHGYGAAIDFNAGTNQLGTPGNMDEEVVRIAKGRGWTWGGEWSRPDPMHFQFGGGY